MTLKLKLHFYCYLPPAISCVFVSNLNETSEAPNLQLGQKIMRSVLEADLVMNVHRDGQWGAFRHQLLTNGTILLSLLLLLYCKICCFFMVSIFCIIIYKTFKKYAPDILKFSQSWEGNKNPIGEQKVLAVMNFKIIF